VTVAEREGVVPYGTADEPVGNFLLYPRRAVLEVLARALQADDLFTDVTVSGRADERNPFLLVLRADGGVDPTSRIILSDSGSEHLEKTNQRPRITVDRGPGRFVNGGIGQRSMFSPGRTEFVDLFETGLQIRCVGRHKAESEALALVVIGVLWFARETIKKKAHLQHLTSPEISQTLPEVRDSEVTQYVTSVSMSITQTVRWVVQPLNVTRLNEICVTTSSTANA